MLVEVRALLLQSARSRHHEDAVLLQCLPDILEHFLRVSNVLDKLEGVLTNQGVVLTLGSPLYSKGNPNTVVPQRVMVGGADRMENLLPKSP